MQLRRLALSIAAVTAIGCWNTASAYSDHEEQIIVHPFQWTYDMIAEECEKVLGPNGYDGVQISQPAEHIAKTDAWWAVYQPVNFNNFTTMTGNEQQLRNMIKRCNAAGVRVYADAVFNQRGSYGNVGLGGSPFNAGTFSYPDLVYSDFNDYKCNGVNYGDQWSVYHCALSGMPDLNVENPSTQDKVAAYLKNLKSMGVYGFRIDAAKHMQPWGIKAILEKAGNPFSYMEVIGASGEAVQPRDYTGIPNTVVTEFKYCPTMDNNIKNPKVLLDMADSWFDVPSDGAETFVLNHDNERCSAGTCYMNYKSANQARYNIAQSFLVAWPYGKVRQVYSGYEFNGHDQAGPIGTAACTGGWHCEHRSPIIKNAVGFARATRGQGVSSKGSDGQVVWFNRGNKGFYVMNASDYPITKTFDVKVPDGQYCEILQQDEKCGGQMIDVKGGKATIMVYERSAAAICVDDSGKGLCGGKQINVCEINPTSAACLCEGQATTGGVCVKYCQANSSDESCKCLNNPSDKSCTNLKSAYFSGTTNGWKFTEMEFDGENWTLPLQLTGAGDKGGAQRFKITTAADWKHKIYGDGGNGTLCADEVKCGDIFVTQSGNYTLKINDKDLSWKLIEGQDDNHVPVAAFTTDTDELKVTFTDNSYDQDGDTLTYAWEFGDGAGATVANPEHTYAQAGDYKVTLVVNDGKVSSKASTATVHVEGNVSCQPKMSALYYAGVTNGWTHDAMSYNYNTCKWEIALNLTGEGDNNGAQRFKVTSTPNWKGKVYGTAGANKLCDNQSKCGDVKISQVGEYVLSVNDENMTWELNEISGNHAPVADFTITKDKLTLTANSTSTDADGDELTCEWNIEGSVYNDCSVTHEFGSAGKYDVTLTVSDGQSEAAVTKEVEVTNVYIAPTRSAMFYAGTTNSWGHDAMTYNAGTGNWEIKLNLTGAGDNNGAQRFKVTSTANWKGTVWGNAGGNKLCSNQSTCGDVFIGEVGEYVLKVNDKNLTWVLEEE